MVSWGRASGQLMGRPYLLPDPTPLARSTLSTSPGFGELMTAPSAEAWTHASDVHDSAQCGPDSSASRCRGASAAPSAPLEEEGASRPVSRGPGASLRADGSGFSFGILKSGGIEISLHFKRPRLQVFFSEPWAEQQRQRARGPGFRQRCCPRSSSESSRELPCPSVWPPSPPHR